MRRLLHHRPRESRLRRPLKPLRRQLRRKLILRQTKPPPAKPKKHKAVPPAKPIVEPTVTLVPGPAEAAININARGQAGLKGEVVAHLKKGDAVTVLGQINLSKHKAGEPAQWAKIALPSSTHVWINSKFVDATSKTVSVKKLNLRGGPGENYSVLGVIESGTPVKEIQTKGDWMEIEAPNNAYAFVAAMYLTQAASSTTVSQQQLMAATQPASGVAASGSYCVARGCCGACWQYYCTHSLSVIRPQYLSNH